MLIAFVRATSVECVLLLSFYAHLKRRIRRSRDYRAYAPDLGNSPKTRPKTRRPLLSPSEAAARPAFASCPRTTRPRHRCPSRAGAPLRKLRRAEPQQRQPLWRPRALGTRPAQRSCSRLEGPSEWRSLASKQHFSLPPHRPPQW